MAVGGTTREGCGAAGSLAPAGAVWWKAMPVSSKRTPAIDSAGDYGARPPTGQPEPTSGHPQDRILAPVEREHHHWLLEAAELPLADRNRGELAGAHLAARPLGEEYLACCRLARQPLGQRYQAGARQRHL